MTCCRLALPLLLVTLLLFSIGCSAPRPVIQLRADDEEFAVAAAFSPDGQWLAAGDARGVVRIWELPGGRLVARRDGFAAPRSLAGRLIAFSPDGGSLAFSSPTGVTVWDRKRDTLTALREHQVPAHDLLFTDDGRLVAVGGGHHVTPGATVATRQPLVITTWDARSGQLLSRAEDDTSGAINAAIAPGGGRFVMNCIEGAPRRFDQLTPTTPLRARLKMGETASARTVAAVDLQAGAGAWHIAFSHDGRSLFTSSLAGTQHGYLRDAQTLGLVKELPIGAAIFSADGRSLISLHVERVGVFHPSMLIMPVAVQRSDWRVVTVDLETGRRRSRRIKLPAQHRDRLEPLAFTRDRRLLVDQALRVWQLPRP